MAKLEEDYTYLQLQAELRYARNRRNNIDLNIKGIMQHINAIKRDYLRYELDSQP